MSFPDYLLLAVVLLCGAPSALRVSARWRVSIRNATALALVLSYAAAEGLWLATGAAFDTRISLLIDLTMIAVIYCKPPAHDCWPYRDWKHQLVSAWFERSLWDRIVLAIFPAMWAVYYLPLAPATAWWSLYWLGIAQFIAAGGEALQTYLNARAANASSAPDSSAGSPFTSNWREWGYG